MQDGVGFLQELRGPQGQQIGIARTGAHDVGDADRRLVATRGIEVAQHDATRTGFVAGQREARRRPFDQTAPEARDDGPARRSGR